MSAVSFLICDPSPALQTFFHQLLTHHGFDAAAIKTAASPQAAAEMAISLQPDLLITDWFAKETLLNGPALFREVSQFCPGCRPALMAQGVGPEHEQQARDVGALFLLNKPFTADAARSAVTQALEELGKTHPPIAQRLHAHHEAAAHTHRPAQIQLPPMPHYKPGDAVMYRNRTERVQYVILRRGEMVIQLQGVPGMVEADRVQPL